MYLKKNIIKGDPFFELLGKSVTFDCELITIGGQILHAKGEKAIIFDVEYMPGHYHSAISNFWVPPKINTVRIVGDSSVSYTPATFLELKNI